MTVDERDGISETGLSEFYTEVSTEVIHEVASCRGSK
jgi:hypothetical protein